MQRNTVSFRDHGCVEGQNARQFFDWLFRILLCEFRGRARGAPPPVLSPFRSSREVLGWGSPSAPCEKKEKEKGGIIVVATELWPS